MRFYTDNRGFTMASLTITVLVIIALSSAVFFWIDPLTKIGEAKDARRQTDVDLVAQAIAQYVRDNKGVLPVLGAVTTDKKTICEEQSGSSISCGGDSQDCIRIADDDFYNDYLGTLPIDPDKEDNTDTGYYLQKNSEGNLVVGACSTYGSTEIITTLNVKITCDAYAGGYCWYASDSDWVSCDTVCSGIGLDCVDGAIYGPDVNSEDSLFCALQKGTGAECSSCTEGSDPAGPPIYATIGYCESPNGTALSCSSQSDQGDYPVCPCE